MQKEMEQRRGRANRAQTGAMTNGVSLRECKSCRLNALKYRISCSSNEGDQSNREEIKRVTYLLHLFGVSLRVHAASVVRHRETKNNWNGNASNGPEKNTQRRSHLHSLAA